MGLAEKRSSKEFADKEFPAWQKRLQDAAGFPVEVAVNWDQLSEDGMSHLFAEAWPKVYFAPIEQALKSITVDDMGKSALKTALKKINAVNVQGISDGGRCCTFSAGVLTIDHKPFTNIDDVSERAASIQSALEKAL